MLVPRANSKSDFRSEAEFKGRFFLVMTDIHVKILDLKNLQLFDLLSEPGFDMEAVNGFGLARSPQERTTGLLLLCLQEVRDDLGQMVK